MQFKTSLFFTSMASSQGFFMGQRTPLLIPWLRVFLLNKCFRLLSNIVWCQNLVAQWRYALQIERPKRCFQQLSNIVWCLYLVTQQDMLFTKKDQTSVLKLRHCRHATILKQNSTGSQNFLQLQNELSITNVKKLLKSYCIVQLYL